MSNAKTTTTPIPVVQPTTPPPAPAVVPSPDLTCDANGQVAVGDMINHLNGKINRVGDKMTGPLEVPSGAKEHEAVNYKDMIAKINDLIANMPVPDTGLMLSADGESIVKTDGSHIFSQVVAFCHYRNGAVQDSFNIASIVKTGTGVYSIKFEKPMDIPHYIVLSNSDESHAFMSADGYSPSGFKTMNRRHDGRMVNDNFEIAVLGGRK